MKRTLLKFKLVSILALCLFFFAASSASAQYTWKGTINSNWNNPSNWLPNGVPGQNDDATIPASSPTFPVMSLGDEGGIVIIEAGAQLTLNADIEIGALAFDGPLASLNTGNYTLTIKESVYGETNDSYIIGKVKLTKSVNTLNDPIDFGGIGFNVTSVNEDWGNVSVIRTTGTDIDKDGKKSIKRLWDISSTITPVTNNTINLTLAWLSSEANGNVFASNNTQVWGSTNGTTWNKVGSLGTPTATLDGANNPVSYSMPVTTTSLSKLTISDQNNPLPVTWLYFNGKKTEAGTELTWATATEKNSQAFIIERSANGKNFEEIATVEAAGNSNQQVNYTYTDLQNKNTKTYYRLKQTDLDGTFSYSAIITVSGNNRYANLQASVYPNPFGETLNLRLANSANAKEVVLISLDGKEVYRKNIASPSDLTLTGFPELRSGMYLLQIISDNGIATVKVNRQ